jgi:hypothetical protein
MKRFFQKSILVSLIAALAVAAMPLISASAAGASDPIAAQGQVSNEKLEQVWAHQLKVYERIGKGFDRLDDLIAKAQRLIDKANANGQDVSAVQAALDAFKAASKDAHPIYESGKGIVNSHQGFDANGTVTAPEKAKETVREMRDKLQEIKSAMDGTGKALREAIKAFREANPHPQPATTPEA